jgi:hypothetical protein
MTNRGGSKRDILRSWERAGIYVATWSPGDGTTRYKFFLEPLDYFEGDGLAVVVGWSQALAMGNALAEVAWRMRHG